MNTSNPSVVEGVDYYIEDDKYVFTAAYHQKRGYCCKNGCRHCPFGDSADDRTKTVGESAPDTISES